MIKVFRTVTRRFRKDSLIVSVILTGFDTDDEGVLRNVITVLNTVTTVPFLSEINKRPIVSIKSCVSSRVKGLCWPNCLVYFNLLETRAPLNDVFSTNRFL